MRKHLSTSLSVSLLTAGLIGASPALAFASPETDGSGSIAGGNQVNVPADVEAELCGNAISALGISQAECTRVAKILYASSEDGASPSTDGSGSVAGGNQINIPVDAALDLCGNSGAIGGIANAECTSVVKKLAKESGDGEGGDSPKTDGSGSIAGGNQINVPVDVALDVCGNSIAVLGASKAECTTVVNVIEKSEDNKDSSDEGDSPQTDGSGSIGGGNQVNVPVDAAVDICGNAVSVLGVAEGECIKKISKEEDGGDKPEKPEEPGDDPEKPGDDDKDDGDKDKPGDDGDGYKPEPSTEPSDDSTPDEKPAPEDGDDSDASGGLPVTGPALGAMVAAAVAAIGGGGAAMYFSRRRKAAAAAAGDDHAVDAQD